MKTVRPSTDAPIVSPGGGGDLEAVSAWLQAGLGGRDYEVETLLGRGGMGAVYKVRSRDWGVDMAVKVPLSLDAAGWARLSREAETWIALGLHPHIVQCFFVKEVQGLPCVFAECASGGSLRAQMRRNVGPGEKDGLARSLDWIIQACDGLAYAYGRGVAAHRDITPANLLLTETGDLAVSDFGIAKLKRAGARPGSSDQPSFAGWGTAHYAAPEQVRGDGEIDLRADIFSLGVILCELGTGRHPFDDGTEPEPSFQIRQRAASWEIGDLPGLREGLPAELAAIVERCVRKNPADRFDSIGGLRDALCAAYRSIQGRDYASPPPAAPDLSAGALNNRGASLWMLGEHDAAREAWRRALEQAPTHVEATFNLAVVDWRAGEITDEGALQRLGGLLGAETAVARLQAARGALAGDRDDQPAIRVTSRRPVEIVSRDGRTGLTLHRERRLVPPPGAANRVPRSLPVNEAYVVDGGLAGDVETLLRLHVWDLERDQLGPEVLAAPFDEQFLPIWHVSLDPTKRHGLFVTKNAGTYAYLVDLQQGSQQRVPAVPGLGRGQKPRCFSVGVDGRVLAGAAGIFVWSHDAGWASCAWPEAGAAVTTALAHTRDGKRAIAGGEDGVLRLWEMDSGGLLLRIPAHTAGVSALAVNTAVTHAVSLGADSRLRLWNLETRACERAVEQAPAVSGTHLVVSDDARYVLVRTREHVRIWDLTSGHCVRTLPPDASGIVAHSARDRTAADLVWVPDAPMPHPALTLSRPFGHHALESAQRSLGGLLDRIDRLVTKYEALEPLLGKAAGLDGRARGRMRRKMAMIASRARNLLLRARSLPGRDRSERLRELWRRAGRNHPRMRSRGCWLGQPWRGGAASQPFRLIPSAHDGESVWLQGADSIVRWNVTNGSTEDWPAAIAGRALAAGSRSVVATDEIRGSARPDWYRPAPVTLWSRAADGNNVRAIATCIARSAAFSSDGRLLIVGGDRLLVFDAERAVLLDEYDHFGRIVAIALDERRSQAVALLRSGGLARVRLAEKRVEMQRPPLARPVVGTSRRSSLTLSPDGQFALVGWDKELVVWDIDGCRPLSTHSGNETVTAVRYSPDGRHAIIGTESGRVLLWTPAAAGAEPQEIQRLQGAIEAVSFADDMDTLVVGLRDGAITGLHIDWDFDPTDPYGSDASAEGAEQVEAIARRGPRAMPPLGLSRDTFAETLAEWFEADDLSADGREALYQAWLEAAHDRDVREDLDRLLTDRGEHVMDREIEGVASGAWWIYKAYGTAHVPAPLAYGYTPLSHEIKAATPYVAASERARLCMWLTLRKDAPRAVRG